MLGSGPSQSGAAGVQRITMTCAVCRRSPRLAAVPPQRLGRLCRTALLTSALTLLLASSAWGGVLAGVSSGPARAPHVRGALSPLLHTNLPPAVAGPNWIQNPGFESPLSGVQQGLQPGQSLGNWLSWEPGPGIYGEVTTPVHSGLASASILDPANDGTMYQGGLVQDIASFPSDQSYTLSGWVYPSHGDGALEVSFGWNRMPTNQIGPPSEGSVVQFAPTSTATAAFGQEAQEPAVSYGAWHYFELTVDAASRSSQLYIDGDLAGSTTSGAAVPAGLSTTVLVGTPYNPNGVPGSAFYWDDLSLTTTGSSGNGSGPSCASEHDRVGNPPLYDQQSEGPGGRKIVSIGDPTTAQHIAVLVPGLGSNYSNFDQPAFSAMEWSASCLKAEIDRLYPGNSSAVIAWLGYDAPQNLVDAASSELASAGGNSLASYLESLRAKSQVPGGPALTVIAHSYGTVTAAYADVDQGLLSRDNLVFVGSPGVDFPRQKLVGNIYAGENPNDVIQFSYVPRVYAPNLGTMLRKVPLPPLAPNASGPSFGNLGSPAGLIDIGHGNDPTSPQFGAKTFGTQGECGHAYFADPSNSGTEALANMARIVTGNTAQVTPETRPPVPAVTPVVTGTNLQLRINWQLDCSHPWPLISVSALPGQVLSGVESYIHDKAANLAAAAEQKIVGALAPVLKNVINGGKSFASWLVNTAQGAGRQLQSGTKSVANMLAQGGQAAGTVALNTARVGLQTGVGVVTNIYTTLKGLPLPPLVPFPHAASTTNASSGHRNVLIASSGRSRVSGGRVALHFHLTKAGRRVLRLYVSRARAAAARHQAVPGLPLFVGIMIRPRGHGAAAPPGIASGTIRIRR